MNRFLDLVDRYKFSIVAVLLAYTGMFMYLQLTEIPEYKEIDSFRERINLDQPIDEIELTPENLEIAPQYEIGKVTNTSRDMNDKRERSDEDYSATKETSDGEKSARETEQKYKDEARNSSYNKEVDKLIEERNKNKEKQKENSKTNPNPDNSSNNGGKFAPKGNVMVEWSLSKRSPHQNNEWYVRNPGYTCGSGSSGRVVVDITVGQDGRVVSAVFNPSGSSSVNACMQEQAVNYAKKSRFDYSATEVSQKGKIYYTFVSQ